MAVVVQELVIPDCAGVLFTRDPRGPQGEEMLLCASPGFGETVVSGRESDTFKLSRDGSVLESRVVPREELLEADPQGGLRRRPLRNAARREAVVSPELAQTLADLGRAVEEALGGPQDIEWALAGGRVRLLQARPVTGLGARPRSVWTRANVGEALPGTATPFTWSIIHGFSRMGLVHAFKAAGCTVPKDLAIVGELHGRVYLNLSEFMEVFSQIPLMSPELLFRLGGGGGLLELPGTYRPRSSFDFLRRLPLSAARLLGSLVATVGRIAAFRQGFDEFRREFHATDLQALDDAELLKLYGRLSEVFDRTGTLLMEVSTQFLLSFMLLSGSLRLVLGGEQDEQLDKELLSGLSGLRSAEPGLDLLRLARALEQRPALAQRVGEAKDQELVGLVASDPELSGAFGAFLVAHGHRAVREAELSERRWREDPFQPLAMLRSYLRAGAMQDPEALLRDRLEARRTATEAVMERFPGTLRGLFSRILQSSQQAARVREEIRSNVVHTMDFQRVLALETGRRLVAAGLVEARSEVFFFKLEELLAFLGGRRDEDLLWRVAVRRLRFEAFRALPEPPEWLVMEGRIPRPGKTQGQVPEGVGGRALVGLAASPGVAVGPARILRGPEDFGRLCRGDIIVAPYADVGWTPLFLLAAGVVTELGGPLSHSCVVAREYGVPAVVNLAGATSSIPDGARVRVDGSRGVVTLEE
jgi:pyruvate,water dikinase